MRPEQSVRLEPAVATVVEIRQGHPLGTKLINTSARDACGPARHTPARRERVRARRALRAGDGTMQFVQGFVVALLLFLLASCSSSDAQLEKLASQLNEAVNRCVIDVRDKTSTYETSDNCRSLGRMAQQYIEAGGLKQSAPCRADRVAESARARTWMAMAISKSGDRQLAIW